MPGSGPGVDGDGGMNGVRAGPNTPGGVSTGGPTGDGIPELPMSMVSAGMAGTQGSNVGGPPIPGVTGAGVGPSPGGGGGPSGGGTKGGDASCPGINGFLSVVVCASADCMSAEPTISA